MIVSRVPKLKTNKRVPCGEFFETNNSAYTIGRQENHKASLWDRLMELLKHVANTRSNKSNNHHPGIKVSYCQIWAKEVI